MTAPIDIDELERLAKAATPGEWLSDEADVKWDTPLLCGYDYRPNHAVPAYFATGPRVTSEEQATADNRFIAAANPQTVLALVERLRLLEGIVRDLANPRTWGGSSWCRFCIGCILGMDREAPEPAMMGMFIHDDSCPYRRAREAAK